MNSLGLATLAAMANACEAAQHRVAALRRDPAAHLVEVVLVDVLIPVRPLLRRVRCGQAPAPSRRSFSVDSVVAQVIDDRVAS
jgi:hypothetical protein